MIIYANSSKKRKPSARKVREYQEWLASLGEVRKVTSSTGTLKNILNVPPGRETPRYPSLNTNLGSCGKKDSPVYTGDKVVGIGTLHKSNAVPIFSSEEAKDQASMRR